MKVLFATDGLTAADHALDLIRRIADPSRVEVTALSVASYEIVIPETPYYVLDLPAERREHAREVAEKAAIALGESGFDPMPRIAEGRPSTRIIEESAGYDLIVLGAGRTSWLGNLLLGSTSTHVLHNSNVSVLIAHAPVDHEGKVRILLGLDGSDHAMRAVKAVATFAAPARCDAKILTAIPVASTMIYPWLGGPGEMGPVAELVDIETEKAEKSAADAVSVLNASGFEVETSVVLGNPARALLHEAKASGFDLVAVGARGLGAVGRAFLGSVSDHVARLAPAALVARG